MQRNGLTKAALHRKSAEEKLLLAARRLFCRAGIHATGISRILEEAGVARRSLYKHYGSKENLLKAVLDTEANMWFHWFDLDLPGLQCSNKDRILALFGLLENWFKKEDFFGCVFINAVAEREKDSAWVKDVAGAYRDQIIERLRALVAESEVSDPDIVTQKLGLIIEGAIITAMVTQNSQAAHIARLAAEDVLRCTGFPFSGAGRCTDYGRGGGSLASHSTENRSTNSGKLLERAQCSLAAEM